MPVNPPRPKPTPAQTVQSTLRRPNVRFYVAMTAFAVIIAYGLMPINLATMALCYYASGSLTAYFATQVR